MPKLKDIAVVVGTYRQGNETKFKWKTVGALIENNGKQYIMLDRTFNPAGVYVESGREGSDQCVMSLFEPQERRAEGSPSAPRSTKAPRNFHEDDLGDIPF